MKISVSMLVSSVCLFVTSFVCLSVITQQDNSSTAIFTKRCAQLGTSLGKNVLVFEPPRYRTKFKIVVVVDITSATDSLAILCALQMYVRLD